MTQIWQHAIFLNILSAVPVLSSTDDDNFTILPKSFNQQRFGNEVSLLNNFLALA